MVSPLTTLSQSQQQNTKQSKQKLLYANSHPITLPNILTMQSSRKAQNDDQLGSSSKNHNKASTPFRSFSSCNRHGRTSSSNRVVQRSASARLARQNTSRELMLNDIVGNGISGILYKWVNYGRGWRPRWFVLHDGVLSYYKIHGSNKLILNRDVEKRSKVIGDESLRRIAGNRHCPSRHRKPVSEIHLMVSHYFSLTQTINHISIFFVLIKKINLIDIG